MKRHTASSGKPPLQKAWSHKADGQEVIPESRCIGTIRFSFVFDWNSWNDTIIAKGRSTHIKKVLKTVSHFSSFSHSGMFTSSYCFAHTMSLTCSPVEANRRIHAIHSHLQPGTTDSQATPPSPVAGPLFLDIQREFQGKEVRETVHYWPFYLMWCYAGQSFRSSLFFHPMLLRLDGLSYMAMLIHRTCALNPNRLNY